MCWKYSNWNSKYWFGRSVENGDHEGSRKVRRYYPKAILEIEVFWIKTLHLGFFAWSCCICRKNLWVGCGIFKHFLPLFCKCCVTDFGDDAARWKRRRFRILYLAMQAEMHTGFLPYWVTGSCDMPCHAQVFKSLRLKVKRHVSKTLRNNM